MHNCDWFKLYDSKYAYELEKECKEWLVNNIGGGDAIYAEKLAMFVHEKIVHATNHNK